jgi:hypothetical protein
MEKIDSYICTYGWLRSTMCFELIIAFVRVKMGKDE